MKTLHQYIVTGASGKIGNAVARTLLSEGHHVRVFGRSKERLQGLIDSGAEFFPGDMHDLKSVTGSFHGMDAAFLIGQGDRASRNYRDGFLQAGRNYATALKAHDIQKAVFISCLGADDERNRGLVLIHSDVEEVLNNVDGLDVVHLRAPSFLENLFYFLQPLKERNELVWPIASDAAVSMASSQDIADVAAKLLSKLDFQGKTSIELYGEPKTMKQIAAFISKESGRSYAVNPATREAEITRLMSYGFGLDFSILMNEAWDALSRGLDRKSSPTSVINLPHQTENFLRNHFIPALAS